MTKQDKQETIVAIHGISPKTAKRYLNQGSNFFKLSTFT